jgi:hypothetical protein
MSARRQNQAELLNTWNEAVGDWSEEEIGQDNGPETGVFARRVPKDSYTHEKPLLSASWVFHAADLLEVDAPDEDGKLVHLLPTLRP